MYPGCPPTNVIVSCGECGRTLRRRGVVLVGLLLLGQLALACHLAQHPFAENPQQEAACTACVVGGHMAMTAAAPVVAWVLAWDLSRDPLPDLGSFESICLKTLRCRGPPALPAA